MATADDTRTAPASATPYEAQVLHRITDRLGRIHGAQLELTRSLQPVDDIESPAFVAAAQVLAGVTGVHADLNNLRTRLDPALRTLRAAELVRRDAEAALEGAEAAQEVMKVRGVREPAAAPLMPF